MTTVQEACVTERKLLCQGGLQLCFHILAALELRLGLIVVLLWLGFGHQELQCSGFLDYEQ